MTMYSRGWRTFVIAADEAPEEGDSPVTENGAATGGSDPMSDHVESSGTAASSSRRAGDPSSAESLDRLPRNPDTLPDSGEQETPAEQRGSDDQQVFQGGLLGAQAIWGVDYQGDEEGTVTCGNIS